MSAEAKAPAKRKASTSSRPKAPAMAAAACPLFVRRYTGQPGPKVVGAAGDAEALLGRGPAELIMVAVPEGELDAARAALKSVGVRFPE